MGGFGGITGLAVSAAVVGTVGAAATTFSSNAQDRYDKQLAKDNAGKKWGEQRPRGDGADATIDGRVRIGLALAAGGSAVTALGAALLHAPGVATVSFGAAAGLLGAALLGGTGSPVKSLASIGNAISSDIHLHHLPTSRSVRAQLPKHAAKAQATPEAKPSAKELLDAPLREMPGVADKAAAKGYAANALAEIDWSKPDIVLWVPATATHSLHVNWSRGAEKQFGDRASVSMVNYPATIDFETSASTGIETLRLVLAGIAEHGGKHRVFVGGHSQGAWVIGDAMLDPTIHAAIDRAMLYGNPGLAKHSYADRADAKVVEVNDKHDAVHTHSTNREQFIRGLHGMETGLTLKSGIDLAVGALGNQDLASYWLAACGDGTRWSHADPHVYTAQYAAGLEWLDTGNVAPGEETAANPNALPTSRH